MKYISEAKITKEFHELGRVTDEYIFARLKEELIKHILGAGITAIWGIEKHIRCTKTDPDSAETAKKMQAPGTPKEYREFIFDLKMAGHVLYEAEIDYN